MNFDIFWKERRRGEREGPSEAQASEMVPSWFFWLKSEGKSVQKGEKVLKERSQPDEKSKLPGTQRLKEEDLRGESSTIRSACFWNGTISISLFKKERKREARGHFDKIVLKTNKQTNKRWKNVGKYGPPPNLREQYWS